MEEDYGEWKDVRRVKVQVTDEKGWKYGKQGKAEGG